jgi:hypothetical protein
MGRDPQGPEVSPRGPVGESAESEAFRDQVRYEEDLDTFRNLGRRETERMMLAKYFGCGAPSGGVFRVPLTTAQREELRIDGPDPFATAYVPVCDACGDRAEHDPEFAARFDAAVIDAARTGGHRRINIQ